MLESTVPNLIRIATPRGERLIGPGQPAFIVAELSGNHNQDFSRALRIIEGAAAAGADAIKLQTFRPETITMDSDAEWFRVNVNEAWRGKTLYELYQSVVTPWEWQPRLKAHAESLGLTVFSSPFDEAAVDFLESLNVSLYKIASFETEDLELLRRVGRTRKPVIISRGMTSAEDLGLAIDTLKTAGAPQVAVLHCVSSYPALPEQMNLATIRDIAQRFGVVAGISDHTLGITVPIAAVALGAHIIEKHVTLRRTDGGPDAAFSLEPEELTQLVRSVREVEAAIGQPTYAVGDREAENLEFRRSLFVVHDVEAGERFTRENVRCIRPGYGLAPKHLERIIGAVAACNIPRGTPLTWEHINNYERQ